MHYNHMLFSIQIIVVFIVYLVQKGECLNVDQVLTNVYGPFSETEHKEMRKEIDNLISFIQIKENKTALNDIPNHVTEHTDGYLCKSCIWTFTKFHDLLKKRYGISLITEFMAILCATNVNYQVCKKAINLYEPVVTEALVEHYLNAEYICSHRFICEFSHFTYLNPDDYARELLKDKPETKLPDVDQSAPKWKVLHITDIHTDLLYSEGSKGLCGTPLCCRDDVGRSKSHDDYAGRWGFMGKCDIPLRTLDLFVETIVNEIKPDFILWTGDNPPHNPWLSNGDEIYNITRVFVDLLYKKYNYSGPVFPSLGNHEEYIADQFNPYEGDREIEFLKTFADIFKIWLDDEAYQSFLNRGFYTSKYLNTNLRIISINSLVCDCLNFFIIKDPTDPGQQFSWMEGVLRQAEKDGEIVYVIGHIPPGDSTYLSQCSFRYNALVDRFSHIIRGNFYGHTHLDEFRLIPEYFNSTKIAGIIYTAPSLTSYSFQHPSFRIYEVDSNTKLLVDFDQYRLNLTEANLTPDVKPKWKVAYSARRSFNVSHLSDYAGFVKAVDRITEDKEWFNFIADMFYAQGSQEDSFIGIKKLPKFIKCRFQSSVFDNYLRCTGYKTWDSIEYVNRFLESLSGYWYKKTVDKEYQTNQGYRFLN